MKWFITSGKGIDGPCSNTVGAEYAGTVVSVGISERGSTTS